MGSSKITDTVVSLALVVPVLECRPQLRPAPGLALSPILPDGS